MTYCIDCGGELISGSKQAARLVGEAKRQAHYRGVPATGTVNLNPGDEPKIRCTSCQIKYWWRSASRESD